MAKKQKSLPNLTDSTKPTDLAQFEEGGHSQQSEQPEVVQKQFQSLAEANAFVNTYLQDPNVPEEYKEDLRNQTWENNHDELTRVIGKLTRDTGRMPTVNQLKDETGLSRQTIHKHLKEFYQSTRYQNQLAQFRMLSERVLATLYKLSTEGDVRAAKVFLDAVGGLPQPVGHPGETANYIQVNNNVKIDQVTFTNLPGPVQQQILDLFLQGLQSTTAVSDK